jgi:antitoxin (DNA-binding transcriptional repressor) of toxin-antitoxin stability system
MTTITSLDLRNNYQTIGQKAALGQSFRVTYRGNVLFDIVPSAKSSKKSTTFKNGALRLLDKIKKIEEVNKTNKVNSKVMNDEEFDEVLYQDKAKKYLI